MSRFLKHIPSLLSILVGILTSLILSHPKSPAKKRIPTKSAKSVYLLPNLKVHRKTHYYHLHHWVYFGVVYLGIFAFRKTFKGKKVVEGFFLGLVLQGFSYSDRFKVKFEIPVASV